MPSGTPRLLNTTVPRASTTVTWDTSVGAKSAMLFEASPEAGKGVRYVTSGQGTGSGTTPTITTGSITNGDLVVGAVHTEYGTSNTFTADADTTNGNWSALQGARAGTTTGGIGNDHVGLRSQRLGSAPLSCP